MNMEIGRVPHQIPSGVADLNLGAHEGKHAAQAGAFEIGQRVHLHLWKYPKLRMFLSECRSFLWRICTVLTSTDTHRVPIGSASLEAPSGRSYPNTRSHACIRDIERISSTRPWATPLDWAAYRDSWEAGVRWAVSTFDNSLDSEHKASLLSCGDSSRRSAR